MADPTEDQIADAIATAHWWTRRGVCRDGCGCDGCVSSAVLLYLYELKQDCDADHPPEPLYLEWAAQRGPCPAFVLKFPGALLCVTCGLPEDRHQRQQMDAEDCGHV